MAQQARTGPRANPQNDLYTFWLIVAAGLLLIGIVYLAVRASQLFGTIWPPAGG